MPDKSSHTRVPQGFTRWHALPEQRGPVNGLAWSPDGRVLATVSGDRAVTLWDAETGQRLRIISARPTRDVVWSPGGRVLAVITAHGAIQFWDAKTGQRRRDIKPRENNLHAIEWSPDGSTLAVAAGVAGVELWDGEMKELRWHEHAPFTTGVAWSPDGQSLAHWGQDYFAVLDAATLQRRLWIRNAAMRSASDFEAAAWSPDGLWLATARGGGLRLEVLRAETSETAFVLEGHTRKVTGLSFSSDGRLLASRSEGGIIRFWRCDTWEYVAKLPGVKSAFHPSAPRLATGEATTAYIWELDFDSILGVAPMPDSVHYTTAKIVLVGDSGTGKTGLGWRLAHGQFKEQPSTHGQQFWVIKELGTTRPDGTECEAVLWDLAGQPDYRLLHVLFLGDVDLALVLFDPADRVEPMKGVEYWLKQLTQKGRKPTILVGARADRGTPMMTAEELEEFCRQSGVSCGYVSTSALTGEGLEELVRRVKASVNWGAMTATVTTRTFKRVKEFVLRLKEAGGGGVLVSPAGLRARLEATDAAWAFTDAEMMTAVRHLSNHGYVAVLRGSSGEEIILLAPDLLANLASSFVLEARRNPRGLGALEESHVLAGGYEFPELAGLDERERDVLLDAAVVLFIEHNLCFRETLATHTLLIFPALINQKRPVVEEVETVEDVSYRLTGAVENVYAALVVQLGYTNTFTRTNQWQNQAEYETARGGVCGFRQVEEREGEAELVLYYAKGRGGARPLFQGLFEEFLRGRDVTVTKFPPVQCPKCKYHQQRAEVVKRIGEGKGFLFCGECGKKIALPKEGERVALSAAEREQLEREQERARRRTAFESALVRVKAVVRDEGKKSPSCFVSYAWGDEGQERWVRRLARDLENAGIEVILDRKDNPQMGASVARFVGRIEQSDFVVVVGTPLYRRKYENRLSEAGSVVAAEVDLINLRLTRTEGEKATVLPLLLEGDERTSFPPLVRGRVYGRFAEDALYFPALFDLILTLYRIPFEHPAVLDLRNNLCEGAWYPR